MLRRHLSPRMFDGGVLFEELYFADLLAYSDEMASIIVSL
jgi:hypothetical protein